jgi:quinol-cytochrome oxidoreductase complex cytochrome b subunit
MFQTLKYIPAKIWKFDGEVIGILTFSFGFLLLFLVPFLDRAPGNQKRRMIFSVCGVLVLLYMAVMTVVGYVT